MTRPMTWRVVRVFNAPLLAWMSLRAAPLMSTQRGPNLARSDGIHEVHPLVRFFDLRDSEV